MHGVAHELRAPLARLRFAADLDDDSAGPSVDDIVQDMEALVTEILQYSRYHHGQFELDLATIKPDELVAEAVSRLQPTPPHIAVEIDDRIQGLPLVALDEALYLRGLNNLLLNACRFARSRIRIEASMNDGQFVLHVDDDGPGVPPGKKAFIFEPFTRLDPSRSRESGGAGLGLAILRGIVSRHGGTVGVEDGPLGGARFTIAVPAGTFADS